MKSKALFPTGTQAKNALVFVSAESLRVLLSLLVKGGSADLSKALLQECESRLEDGSWSMEDCKKRVEACENELQELIDLAVEMLPEHKNAREEGFLGEIYTAVAAVKLALEKKADPTT